MFCLLLCAFCVMMLAPTQMCTTTSILIDAERGRSGKSTRIIEFINALLSIFLLDSLLTLSTFDVSKTFKQLRPIEIETCVYQLDFFTLLELCSFMT
jgi:hypothetical protein